ncbi:hypothetical protein DFH06DRAFT_1213487, partial [Mycena polygramma]
MTDPRCRGATGIPVLEGSSSDLPHYTRNQYQKLSARVARQATPSQQSRVDERSALARQSLAVLEINLGMVAVRFTTTEQDFLTATPTFHDRRPRVCSQFSCFAPQGVSRSRRVLCFDRIAVNSKAQWKGTVREAGWREHRTGFGCVRRAVVGVEVHRTGGSV